MQNEKFTALLNGEDTRAFAQAASTDAIYALLNAAGVVILYVLLRTQWHTLRK